MDGETIALYLGAIGMVIIISGLLSGVVARGPLSEVIVFIALGVLVGPWGFGLFDFSIDSSVVEVAGTICLVLVFFTDAIKINLGQLRQNWLLPALALGPGALLTMIIAALGARWLFDLSWSVAFLIAALLASTDAVLLRDVLNNRLVPRSVRHTLSIEAGANDVIILPVLLVLATLVAGESKSGGNWAIFALDLYVLGPLAGAVIAFAAVTIISRLRRRKLVSRDYESLYSIGVAFVAFAVAEHLGGSGLLAAFAAGLTIALTDVELCDCFLEYGETTSEMAMLLTFVFLGASLVDTAWSELSWRTAIFAVLVLAVARPVAFGITLARSQLSLAGKGMIAWFGPRGLNSLLLMILAFAEGIAHDDMVTIYGIVSVVVMASILVHGISATPLIAWYGRHQTEKELPEETIVDAAELLHLEQQPVQTGSVPRVTPAALRALMESPAGVTVIDTRRQAAIKKDPRVLPGSLRIPIDEILDRRDEIPIGKPVVLTCT